MHRQFDRDPTEFFSVVGAPYVRERTSRAGEYDREFRRTGSSRGRGLKVGVATIGAGVCAVLFGTSLFATSGAARLVEVAYWAVK